VNVKPPPGTPLTRRTARWFDDRLGVAGVARKTLDKVFPDHWSFLIGEIAMWSFIILLLTGTWLTFFFEPSLQEVHYEGSYAPLQGVEMSRAYASTLDISFDIRAGLVMRQMHHWAALLFMAAIAFHLCRVFFTGAFRRPREVNWVVGGLMLVLGMANGFAGYSLVDDQLSGTGLRIAYNLVISIPLVGTWVANLLFGGEFPGEAIIARLYVIHILLLPAALIALLGVHLAILVRQRHTQFAGPKRRQDNIVGERVWPTYAAKGLGMFFLTAAILALLGGVAQINPVWLYGPYRPADVSAASQPDWYMGWLDGALRLMPNWEIRAFGFEVPNPFFPGVLMPGIAFGLLFGWPWIEARVTGDRREHHLLDRPRDRPVRTGIGAAAITFYSVLFFAGASDVLALTFDLSVSAVFTSLRVLLFVAPPVVFWVTYRLCIELAHRDRPGRSDQATPVAEPADDSGIARRREIAPEDAPEHDPGSEAGLPRA
jgi:ubiquinol-cytochrome c reductase cytochrome b subunit